MKILDDLNIEPGYAVIHRRCMDHTHVFAKSQLEANGFTVEERMPPCEELEDTIVIRRINLPNLNEKAYIYLLWEYLQKGDVNTLIDDFCETALNIQDPRYGHLHFIREEEPRLRAKHRYERGMLSIVPALYADEDFDDDEVEIDEADREDLLAMQIASKTSEDLLDIISKLIKTYAIKEHSFAPIDQLLEAAKAR